MNILGIIPARGGSKGIPGKNIKLLCGKPLLCYTSEMALKSKLLSKVILSTDSEEIAEVGTRSGLHVPFIRPSELAADNIPTIDVVKHSLKYFADINVFYDAVCILQPTCPLRPEGFIDNTILHFIKCNADSLISVIPVPHAYNPHWVLVQDGEKFLKISTGESHIIPRRQELPKAYIRDGSVYLTTQQAIYASNSLLGERISYVVSDPEHYVNIDTIEDWKRAEELICKQN